MENVNRKNGFAGFDELTKKTLMESVLQPWILSVGTFIIYLLYFITLQCKVGKQVLLNWHPVSFILPPFPAPLIFQPTDSTESICLCYSHVIYAPSLHNSYGGSSFPGLVDSMFGIGDASDPQWEEVSRQHWSMKYNIVWGSNRLWKMFALTCYCFLQIFIRFEWHV